MWTPANPEAGKFGPVDDAEVGRRKSRSNRAVLLGLALMAVALLLTAYDLGPLLVTTAAGIAGFALVMHGVHVGWLVFYERESDGPAS